MVYKLQSGCPYGEREKAMTDEFFLVPRRTPFSKKSSPRRLYRPCWPRASSRPRNTAWSRARRCWSAPPTPSTCCATASAARSWFGARVMREGLVGFSMGRAHSRGAHTRHCDDTRLSSSPTDSGPIRLLHTYISPFSWRQLGRESQGPGHTCSHGFPRLKHALIAKVHII